MNTSATLILFLGVFVYTTSSVRGCNCTCAGNSTDQDLPSSGGLSSCLKAIRKQILEAFRKQVLDRHNEVRAKHGSPPLKLIDELNDYAQSWATFCAIKNGLPLSPLQLPDGSPVGENKVKVPVGEDVPELMGAKAVDAWYNEVKYHNFDKDAWQANSSHFTQVVWKSTTELGVGMVQSVDDKVLYVSLLIDLGATSIFQNSLSAMSFRYNSGFFLNTAAAIFLEMH